MTRRIKDEMIENLTSLIEGTISRKTAADWAVQIIDDDSVNEISKKSWDILVNIGAADLIAPDRPYLYEIEDFKDWLSKLLED